VTQWTALPVVVGNELVDEALGVSPAERVVADAESSGATPALAPVEREFGLECDALNDDLFVGQKPKT